MKKDSLQILIERLRSIHDHHEPWNVRKPLMDFIQELEKMQQERLSTGKSYNTLQAVDQVVL